MSTTIKGKLYLKPTCKKGKNSGKTWAMFVLMNNEGHQYHCLVFGELAEKAEQQLNKCSYDEPIEVLGKTSIGDEPETTKVFVNSFRLESGEEPLETERDKAIKKAGGVDNYKRDLKQHYECLRSRGLVPIRRDGRVVWEPERCLLKIDNVYHKPLEFACDVLGAHKVSKMLIEGGASASLSNVKRSRKVIREIVELALCDLKIDNFKWGKNYE